MGWKFGDPLTPELREKAEKTRARKKAQSSVKSISGHLRQLLQEEDFSIMPQPGETVARRLAKAMLTMAAMPGKEQFKALQEVADRTEGKAKQTVEMPEPIEGRAHRRQTISRSEEEQASITLRKAGLDREADALLRRGHERNSPAP